MAVRNALTATNPALPCCCFLLALRDRGWLAALPKFLQTTLACGAGAAIDELMTTTKRSSEDGSREPKKLWAQKSWLVSSSRLLDDTRFELVTFRMRSELSTPDITARRSTQQLRQLMRCVSGDMQQNMFPMMQCGIYQLSWVCWPAWAGPLQGCAPRRFREARTGKLSGGATVRLRKGRQAGAAGV